MRIFVLIVGSIFVLHLLWWWWADRRVRRLRWSGFWRGTVGVFGTGAAGYMVWMFVAPQHARQAHSFVPIPALAVVYLWYLIFLPIAVAGMVLWLAGWSVGKGIGRMIWPRPGELLDKDESPDDEPQPSRREVLGAAVAATPLLLTGATAGYGLWHLDRLRVRRFELVLPQLPVELDGLTIAHLSDVHVGRFTRGEQLREIAEVTNQLRSDLVLQTGDLIDLSLSDLPAAMDMVNRLDPRHGLVMCEGNHDLIEDREEFRRRVRGTGVPLLLNESRMITVRGREIQFLGVQWARGEEQIGRETRAVAALRDPEAFPILLAHHPHVFDYVAELGIPLTLAGHTHGGQLMFNERLGAGPVLFRYNSGHYRRGDSSLVVSNGAGNWFPLRVNAPAEIIHLTLRAVG